MDAAFVGTVMIAFLMIALIILLLVGTVVLVHSGSCYQRQAQKFQGDPRLLVHQAGWQGHRAGWEGYSSAHAFLSYGYLMKMPERITYMFYISRTCRDSPMTEIDCAQQEPHARCAEAR